MVSRCCNTLNKSTKPNCKANIINRPLGINSVRDILKSYVPSRDNIIEKKNTTEIKLVFRSLCHQEKK